MGNVTGFVTGVCYTVNRNTKLEGPETNRLFPPFRGKIGQRARGPPERGGCMGKLQRAPEPFLSPVANRFRDAVDRVSA